MAFKSISIWTKDIKQLISVKNIAVIGCSKKQMHSYTKENLFLFTLELKQMTQKPKAKDISKSQHQQRRVHTNKDACIQ